MRGMRRSDSRIRTTHTGSLARPAPLLDLLLTREDGQGFDQTTFDQLVSAVLLMP